jgi:hypothetical protein
MIVVKKPARSRRVSELTYRKLSERMAILCGREMNRLNSRTR